VPDPTRETVEFAYNSTGAMPPQHGGRLLRPLTTVDRLPDLLPGLQKHVLAAVGGVSSVILHSDRRSDDLFPVSGYRVESLALGPWLTSPAERAALREALAAAHPFSSRGSRDVSPTWRGS
jgi:hypothetical protein